MSKPVEIESRFQDLILVLSFPSSPWQRLMAIGSFIADLDGGFRAAEPYLLDIAQRLPEVIQQLHPEGLSPIDLFPIVRSLDELEKDLPVLRSISGFDDALKRLKRNLALQLVYVGEIQQAASLITESPLVLPAGRTGSTPFELLEHGLVAAKNQNHPVAALFAEFLRHWKERIRPIPARTVFPTVEKPLKQTDRSGLGRIRGAAVEFFGETKNGSDDIHSDIAVLRENEQDFLATAIPAARSLLLETHPGLAEIFFAGRVRFEDLSALHEGYSANLAVASLLYCEILRFTNQRTVFQLSPLATLTGATNQRGDVLPIESSTLASKVTAVFFSWIDFLAVPRAQFAEAELIANGLHQVFPARTLTIIPVGTVKDVFYDRRLSTLNVVSALRFSGRVAWKTKAVWIPLMMTALLALAIFKIWLGPMDKRPAYVDAKGEQLFVRNHGGEVLDSIRVRRITVETIARSPSFGSITTLVDLNDDGKVEIIWAEATEEKYKETSILSCRVVGADTLMWRHEVRKHFSFPYKREAETSGFGVSDIIAADVDGRGQPDIFFAAQNAEFVGIIVRLDGRTGQEMGCYLNMGHLHDLIFANLKGIGKPLLVGCGVNNAYSRGCLVVLDPSRMNGHSPSQGGYVVDSLPPARELYYLLAPRSTLAEIYSQTPHNNSQSVENDSVGRGILWNVRDIWMKKGAESRQGVLRFHLNADLSLREVGSTTEFDFFMRTAVAEGRLAPINNDEYLRRLGANLQYWDGSRWTKKAAMNKQY